jgi:peptidyl-prolyl cis-trans isomerase SurA
MKKIFSTLVLVFLIVASLGTLRAQNNRELLNISGDAISVDEFKHIYEKNKGIGQKEEESLEDYLEKFIKFKLKVREAKDLGMDTLASFKKEFSGYRKQLAEPYFVDESIIDQLSEEAIERQKYDVRASHILFKVGENAMPEDTLKAFNKALEVRKRIIKGADFGEMAVKYSDDPSAKDREGRGGRKIKGNRGDLGYFSSLNMVYPFENAVYNMKVGEISMPVRTAFGYHIIKLTDKSPACGTIKVAHLFLKMPPTADKNDSIAIKKTADSLYTALKNGASYTELVSKYSDDKGTIAKGGELPSFTANRMVPEFIEAIKQLSDSGQISRPVLTSYGWHIIQLHSKTGYQMDEKSKKKLIDKIRKDSRSQKSKSVIINEIKKEYSYLEYPENLQDIYPMIDSTIFSKKWQNNSDRMLNKKLMKIGDKTYTQRELVEYIEKNQGIKKDESFAEFVNRSFKEFSDKMCIAYEDVRLEKKHPEFKLLVDEYRDGILLFDLMDQKVWTKANKDTTGLKAFYAKHKKDYLWDERVKAQLFIIYDKEKADAIYQDAKNGKSKEEIEKAYNDKESSKTVVKIEEKLYSKGDQDIVDQAEWKKGISALSEYKGKKAFVKILDIIPPQPKEFNEARGLVIADYQDYLKEEWEKDLASKYKVKINKKELKALKKELK